MEDSINNENYFFSSKDDSDEIRKMYIKGNNVDILMDSETDEIIAELFEFLLKTIKRIWKNQ